MGNDRKSTPDVAKSPPGAALVIAAANLVPDHVAVSNDRDEGIDAGAGVGGSSQGQPGPGDPIDFCERVHELRFRSLSGATPRVGEPVWLVFANPPHVVSATGECQGPLRIPTGGQLVPHRRRRSKSGPLFLDVDGDAGPAEPVRARARRV